MENANEVFDVKVTIRGTLHTLTSIKQLLSEKLLKSLPKETNEDDLAKHKYREQQDLGFENTNFESQALPSFDVYTPPMTYLEDVEETIGIPMEVEPLNQTQLEDLGLNTCSHDISLSFREVPNVDELEP
ncbi:hypothetical protein Tco_0622784 [Tanacetum coccineum]